MAKQKISKWVWVGIVLFIILYKMNFLGSFITTCTSVEPITISDLMTNIDQYNGTIASTTSITIHGGPMDGAAMNAYNVVLPDVGSFKAVNVETVGCQSFIDLVMTYDNITYQRSSYQYKTLYSFDNKTAWCNDADTFYFESADATSSLLGRYIDHYYVCDIVEVVDEPRADEINDTVVDEEETVTSGTTGSTTTNVNLGTTTPPITSKTTSSSSNITTIIVILVIAGLFLLYWFFEKGGNKGFIKFKKKK